MKSIREIIEGMKLQIKNKPLQLTDSLDTNENRGKGMTLVQTIKDKAADMAADVKDSMGF